MTQKVIVQDQRQNFLKQLETFRDRLLRVDWRNRSILLRKVHLRWSFDLAEFPNLAFTSVERALPGGSDSICLLHDSDLSEEAEEKRYAIKSLYRSERLVEDETGLHDFFVGFPFLQGHLTPQHFVRAPLVLFPARLEHRREVKSPGWYLVFPEDEPPIWNQALLAAARKVAGLRTDPKVDDELEDLAEDLGKRKGNVAELVNGILRILGQTEFPVTPEVSLSEPEKIAPLTQVEISQLPNVRLHLTSSVVLGSFPQASSAIYLDYEALIQRAREGETDQGVIDNLLEAPADEVRDSGSLYAAKDKPLDRIPDRELNFVVASDSSQDAVILEARSAPCTVVRGPPGTGKSQVIVNLISNALWKGEKVLLVCQKRAALDVVFQRLDKSGLSQFAVLLHDERADRHLVYKQLHQLLSKGFNPPGYGAMEDETKRLSQEIDETTIRLNQIADPLWKEHFGIRLHNLYLRLDPRYMPRLDLGGLENRLEFPSLQSLMEKLPTIERGSKKFDLPTHPFGKRASFATLGQQDRVQLLRAIEDSLQKSQADYFLESGFERIERDLTEFLKWHGKVIRIFSPSWRSHGKKGEAFLKSRGDRPGAETTSRWLDRVASGKALLGSLERMRAYFTPDGYSELLALAANSKPFQNRLSELTNLLMDFDEIQAHDARLAQLGPLEKDLVNRCLQQLPIADSWSYILPQEIYFKWVDVIEKASPALKGNPFETYLKLRDKLDRLLEQKRVALGRALRAKLDFHTRSPILPPGDHHWKRNPETDWNKLAYEFGKKRRLKPLRKLYEQFYFQLDRITTCWLMSPESVSEVFPLNRGMFDLVVFDEASQLAVERSLPALYRAKRVVIAGDEKQLRPYDLFQIKEGEEEQEEIAETLATESLLMLAKRIFGFRPLTWHYRSKFQELIDLSNHAFYDGQLQVAGTTDRNPASPPIEWVPVSGIWNERRQNPVEAKKVVDIVGETLAKGEQGERIPSIGIVTFNDPQRQAILDEIDLRASRDPEFDRLIELAENPKSGNLDDRLFVKNIENVQGDERDVIIFSIGYGRNSEGRLKLMFGSLNLEGGENRLNVAVTRAREHVLLVCSFDPIDLKAEHTTNEGPKLLKQYLAYSEAVSANKDDAIKSILADLNPEFGRKEPSGALVFESELEHQVYEALRKLGYEIDTQVGYSGYRIDLAIVHPKDQSKYVLAIECDGSTFHSARSARERDVFRQRFLESRGWKVERVWSRNWWRNSQGETQRLSRAIETLGVR